MTVFCLTIFWDLEKNPKRIRNQHSLLSQIAQKKERKPSKLARHTQREIAKPLQSASRQEEILFYFDLRTQAVSFDVNSIIKPSLNVT